MSAGFMVRGALRIFALIGLLGCSDSHRSSDHDSTPEAGRSGSAGATSNVRVPREHREAAAMCDADRASSEPSPSAPGLPAPCEVDVNCTAGVNGRCLNNRGVRFCSYDECFSDADCDKGGPCRCGPPGIEGNTCLVGNCRTDSDCANGGYCSPTLGQCGNYTGVIGYYCHTPSDECTDDSDCTGNPTSGPGYCMYSPEVAHWLCSYSHCVG